MSEPKRPDGFYDGKIIGTRVQEDTFNEGGMVAVFTVEIDGEEYDCEHPDGSGNKEARGRCEAVFEHLGLPFPKGFLDLSTVMGRDVRVRLKTNKRDRQNAYIATMRQGKTLSTEEINRRLAEDDAIPF